jgi:hypothetical protein
VTPEQRRHLAVDLFNHAWTLMRLPERTPEHEDDAKRFAARARELGERVADDEDREHLQSDLATLP